VSSPKESWCRTDGVLLWSDGLENGPIFDPLTGQTHFLNELPHLLLQAVEAIPRTADELAERIAGPVQLSDEEHAKCLRALAFLASAELIDSLIEAPSDRVS
jgi:hypothetical protein